MAIPTRSATDMGCQQPPSGRLGAITRRHRVVLQLESERSCAREDFERKLKAHGSEGR